MSRASKGLLLKPTIDPNYSEGWRKKWLDDAVADFVQPSAANKVIYEVILRAFWPEGHGIPGPILSEKDVRAIVDYHRSSHGKPEYKDVFRRMRELQGEEGFTSIVKEGTKYQLQSLETSQKREPRIKLAKKEWTRIQELYDYTCANCGSVVPDVKLSPDHRIPRSRGGNNDIENWQPLCEQCNNIKSSTCQGCRLNCHVCSWAYPETYKSIVLSDDNKVQIQREAEKKKLDQSVLTNRILNAYFNKS